MGLEEQLPLRGNVGGEQEADKHLSNSSGVRSVASSTLQTILGTLT